MCMGTPVHYEQPVRFSWKGKVCTAKGEDAASVLVDQYTMSNQECVGRHCLWDAAWLFADLGIDVAALTFADDLDPLLLESTGRLSAGAYIRPPCSST